MPGNLQDKKLLSFISTLKAVGLVQIFSLVIGFINTLVISRWLEPSGRGIYIFLSLIVPLVGVLFEFGLPNAISTFLLRRDFSYQSIFSIGLFLGFVRMIMSGILVTGLWLFGQNFTI